MELQELIERIDRWKARQQGFAPAAAMPPALPTAMDEREVDADDMMEEISADNGIVEDVEPVEEAVEAAPLEDASEVGLDQVEAVTEEEAAVEEVEAVEEIEEP
jgi:hypothetical protein